MPILDQGYPALRLTDELNNIVMDVPDTGGVPSNAAFASCTYLSRTVISSAQLLALRTTPVALVTLAPSVAAPNAIPVIDTISMHYLFATAAYTLNAGTLQLFLGPVANALALCADQSALITNTANRVTPAILAIAVAAQTEALGLQPSIYLGNGGAANYTVGGGSLVVTFSYNIIQL